MSEVSRPRTQRNIVGLRLESGPLAQEATELPNTAEADILKQEPIAAPVFENVNTEKPLLRLISILPHIS